ncbi:pyridoxamine 5'-phosphate oxidase family protein [Puteibacter caeruleilacunae]|nr:pyridoxamine 5'-phosphate oxidase family protein [Puteibacter caeruleilacunae]
MTSTFSKIEKYLADHGLMTLATVTPEGKPLAHSVEYVSEGNTVYFASHPQMRKMQNIANNPAVAYTVDEDYQDWSQIQGIQMTGTASFVEDPAELARIMESYLSKFPQVQAFPPEFAQQLKFVKVEPVEGIWIDSTQGMGHREVETY